MMSINVQIRGFRDTPLTESMLGVCVIAIAAFGATFHSIASIFLGVMFLISVTLMRDYKNMWFSLSFSHKAIIVCLLMFFIGGLFSYINTEDVYQFKKQIGRYLRFALIIPVILFVLSRGYNLSRYFFIGVVLSAPVFFVNALTTILVMPELLPTGQYNKILFGDIAMFHALIIVVLLIYLDVSKLYRAVLVCSLCCVFYVAFLTGTRGAWLIIPACSVIIIYYFSRFKYENHKQSVLILLLLAVTLSIYANKDALVLRYDETVKNINDYYSGVELDTSSGTRLALWESAIDVWRDAPIVGTGLGDFDNDLMRLKAEGHYKAEEIHSSTHNIYIQGLVSTGIVGFVFTLLALVAFPFYFFFKLEWETHGLIKVTGMIFILSFAIFGLTESWTLRAPFLSIYLTYIVALMSGSPIQKILSGSLAQS